MFHGIHHSCLAAVSRLNKDSEDEGEGGSNLKLWHSRLGHANFGSIKKLFNNSAVSELSIGARCM